MKCKTCGGPIHLAQPDGGAWYHDEPIDTLICCSTVVEPGMFDTLTEDERRALSHKTVGWLVRFGDISHTLARVALADHQIDGDLWDRRQRYLDVTHELQALYAELSA